MSHVRGETPTRAGPSPVRKLLAALRRVTGRGARTRGAPRGAVTRGAVSGESLRSRVGAAQTGAPVPLPRGAWRRVVLSSPGWRWISLGKAGRAYPGRGARWQP